MSEEAKPVDFDRLFLKQANLYRLQSFVDQYIIGGHVGPRFRMTEELILHMHGIAMNGLIAAAGDYRKGPVTLTNCPHVPPSYLEVPMHMKAMVEYVNDNWTKRDLIHLSAFVMWRLNWIHPFQNGNGRTSRAAAYLTLCAHHGNLLPPKNSIIAQIVKDRTPYYQALRAVDLDYDRTKDPGVCCGVLEQLTGYMLKEQLKANFS